MTPALRTEGLGKIWGGFHANEDISLTIPKGARHALIGPNGAGKSTFIHLLTGYLQPSAGEVYLDGERITKLPQHQRVRRGMARTFQVNKLFPDFTVLESVLMAVFERESLGTVCLRPVAAMEHQIDEAHALLKSLRLHQQANVRTRHLPYGKQRVLEIALALAARPKLLLLDEPAAGIPGGESTELFEVIADLPRDITILFIEHDMDLVFRFAEQITVLVGGRLMTQGTPEEIAADPLVKEVYLGEAAHG